MPYLTSIERRALERGRNEGLERGRNEGQSQGRMQLLKIQLEHRFGPLPAWKAEPLDQATPSLLDDWAVRVLDAKRVEDVFR